MTHHFKIKYGFAPAEFVSVSGSEVEKAIYAQIKGVPVKLGDSYINGRNIISITPHWHKYTGWYDYYEPATGDDQKQIERDCPDFGGVLGQHQERVRYLVKNNQVEKIGSGVEIKELSFAGYVQGKIKTD